MKNIDWVRDKSTGLLARYDAPQEEAELIFGTDAKLQSIDPFLFNVYEFRNYSLLSKLVIIVGYSFNDSHINDLLGQALRTSPLRKILVVDVRSESTQDILSKLRLDSNHESQIIFQKMTAKEYLEQGLNQEQIEALLKDKEDVF